MFNQGWKFEVSARQVLLYSARFPVSRTYQALATQPEHVSFKARTRKQISIEHCIQMFSISFASDAARSNLFH